MSGRPASANRTGVATVTAGLARIAGVHPIRTRGTVTAVTAGRRSAVATIAAAAQDPRTLTAITAITAITAGATIGARLTGQLPVNSVGADTAAAVTAVPTVADKRQQTGGTTVTAVTAQSRRSGASIPTVTAAAEHQTTPATLTAAAAGSATTAITGITTDTPQGQKARITAGATFTTGTGTTITAHTAARTEPDQRRHRTGPGVTTIASTEPAVTTGTAIATGVKH